MTNELTQQTPQPVEEYAGSLLWQTNKGIYLGCMVETPNAKANFPLEKYYKLPPVGADRTVKSWWWTNGGMVRFIGDRHIFTVGPNGSGKTRKLLLPNLFRLRDWSCVVIDPKGELCAHTAVHRSRGKNHKVVVVDPFGVMKQNYPHLYAKHGDLLESHGFNHLAALNPKSDSFVSDAKKIATALVKTENQRDPYWTMAAQALIKGIIMALKIQWGDEANLNMLRQVLGSEPEKLAQNYIVPTIEKYKKDWPSLVASLGEFTKYSPDDRELSGICRTAKAHTDWLDVAPMQRDLARESFDAATMKEQPTTVYLILPPAELAEQAVWLRLMVTSLLMPLMRSVEVKAGQVPVLFMLDEFAQLGHMEIIQNNYAMLRGFGVKLWTVWQGVGQAEFLYKEWWENFLGQAGAIQSFGLPTDLKSREYFSRFDGEREKERSVINHTKSRNSGGGGSSSHWAKPWEMTISQSQPSESSSTSWSQQFTHERRLKPHELAALDRDETILFDRQGKLHLAVCPQPELGRGKFGVAFREARALIEGRETEAA